MVVTYQATIENRDWRLTNENNALTEYNCSEAKNLSRPCTHLISLNQAAAKRHFSIIRLHITKYRFFKKGDTLKSGQTTIIKSFMMPGKQQPLTIRVMVLSKTEIDCSQQVLIVFGC